MATKVCIRLPDLPASLTVAMPGVGELQQLRESLTEMPRLSSYILRFLNSISVTLAPFYTLIKVLDIIVAIVNCVKAIKDAVSSLSPVPIISCFDKLFKALAALVQLLPPIVYIRLVRDIIMLLRQLLDDLLTVLTALDAEIAAIKATLTKAIEDNDTILLEIGNCAREDIMRQADGALQILAAIGKVINIILNLLDILSALVPGLDKQIIKMRTALDVFNNDVGAVGEWPPIQPMAQAIVALRNALMIVETFLSNMLGFTTTHSLASLPPFSNPGEWA